MIETIGTILALILPLNVLMQGVKYLADRGQSKIWLRTLLGFFALAGVVATSAVTGQDIDLNKFNELGSALIETVVVALLAHFNFKIASRE